MFLRVSNQKSNFKLKKEFKDRNKNQKTHEKNINHNSIISLIFIVNSALTQRKPAASPAVTVIQDVGGTELTLIYSKPSLDRRSIST